jgi:hypothetical protein
MYAKRYHVTFKPRDVACTPPCGMEAMHQSLEETVRSILSRYADATTGDKRRFGRSEVEIKNGLVIVESEDETDVEQVLAILQHYFWVREEANDKTQ